MRCRCSVVAVLVVGFAIALDLRAGDPEMEASPAAIREAILRSIPLLESGMKGSAEERTCFTCHNQAMPVLALAEARARGFAIDEENFERQVRHTEAHLERGLKEYLSGKGQGGQVLTAGYALWTLSAVDRPASETTAAVTHYLLVDDAAADHWTHSSTRPPSSGSDFTTTYVALSGLIEFGTEEQRPEIEARSRQVGDWIRSKPARDTEDRVFKLLAMPYLDAADEAIDVATSELIDSQRADGGWAQNAEMESDAYATGSALVALLSAGNLAPDHASIKQGIEYLLRTQREDGSWHVVTRAKPIQKYFESGFPHGKDQFISMAASSWSTWALLLTLPETP